jgi:hypothetical protein
MQICSVSLIMGDAIADCAEVLFKQLFEYSAV